MFQFCCTLRQCFLTWNVHIKAFIPSSPISIIHVCASWLRALKLNTYLSSLSFRIYHQRTVACWSTAPLCQLPLTYCHSPAGLTPAVYMCWEHDGEEKGGCSKRNLSDMKGKRLCRQSGWKSSSQAVPNFLKTNPEHAQKLDELA